MRQHESGEPVGPVRASLLRSQLEHAGYHIIGLQETRGQNRQIFIAEDYIRIVGGTDNNKGQFGCELWLSRRLPIGSRNGAPVFFKPDRITVLYGDARLLIAKAQADSTAFIFGVCHAPHEQTPEGEKDIWWKRLDTKLRQYTRQGRVFLMGDFNARLSETDGNCVGDKTDSVDTDNGARFLQLCRDHGFWIPSTFTFLHPGEDFTWYNPRGSRSRLDYVVLDQAFKGCVRSSWIDPTIQAPNNAMDHVLAGIQVEWAETTRSPSSGTRGNYDWDAMATQEGRAKLQQVIENLPTVPWNTDVHSHWQLLEDGIHSGLSQHFPAQRPSRRADMFTSRTWEALAKRKSLRTTLDEIDAAIDALQQAISVRAWKDGLTIFHGFKLFSLELYCLTLCRGLCLAGFKKFSKLVRQSSSDDKAAFVATIGDEVAVQSNADIFRSLRKLRVGSCFRKKAVTPLPMLRGPDGEIASSWEARDDIWLQHCSQIEAGVVTTSKRLISRIQEKSFGRVVRNPVRHLREVPSLSELEQAFRRIRMRKAPGADQLRSDLCSLAPAALARAYFPLLFKVSLNYNEPLQSKGGVLVSAFKGGRSDDVSCYRSLLLSSHLGKAMRRTVRQRLVARYAQTAPSLYVSVRAGGNVMHASHALRTFLLAAKQQGSSAAIIYLDVRSAYYRVVRQLAANLTCADEDIARVLQFFDLEPTEMGNLLSELQAVSAMRSAGATEQEELITEEFLHGTWFVTKNRRCLVESLAGTRPGDGLADVIFSYVFQRVMQKVNDELRNQLQWPDPAMMEDFDITLPPPSIPPLPPAIDVIWADDLAYGVAASTASETVETVRQVASTLFKHCLAHGMRPNMSKNKTEIMLQLRGANSRQLKRHLYDCDTPSLDLPEAPEGYQSVRLTGGYRHLGYQVQVSDTMLAEIRSRTGQASSVFRQHRKQVFGNARIPISKRKYLFNSLVLSILRYNLGTWPTLKPKEFDVFSSRVLTLYRGLARATIDAEVLRLWNHDRVMAYLELPSPRVLLIEAQLRYGLSLCRSGPTMLWYLLCAEQGWLQSFRNSLEWLQANLRGYGPNKLGQPFSPHWDSWFRSNQDAVRSWIGKAKAHAVLQHCIQVQWKEWHHQFLLECQQSGLDVAFPWTPLPQMEAQEDKLEACLACHQLFRNKAAWSVHAFKKHNRVNWRRRYVQGSQCPICLKDYSTTTRLLLHLNYKSSCSDMLVGNVNEGEVRPGRNSRKVDKDRLLAVPSEAS